MRASILIWSTVSGAILGMFIDAMLIGVVLIVGTIVPQLRVANRWVMGGAAVVLVGIFVAMSVLGFLEGRLKAV